MRVPGRPGSLLALGLLATAALAVPVSAQLEPLGRERRIDAGVNRAACPAAAALPDGTYLVAWSTGQSEGSFTCRPRGAVHAQADQYLLQPRRARLRHHGCGRVSAGGRAIG